jgi:hypothetical protein
MSLIADISRQSWLASIRWRTIIILVFCLGFVHYIVLTPELSMIEAGNKLLSATPTWAQTVEQVSWGKELTNVTEGEKAVADVPMAASTTLADIESSLPEEEYPAKEETMPQVVAEDTEPLSYIPDGIGAENGTGSHNGSPTSALTSAMALETAVRFDDKGHPVGMDDGYVAMCIAIKDQRLDLPEFLIHHYYHLGIRYFYIMDDGSDPPLSEMQDFGIPQSALKFTYQDHASRDHYMQMVFYDNCLQEYGKLHNWIAFFDTDEFLEVTSPTQTFRGILEEFEKQDHVGALGVNWRMHSSAGLLTRPESARKAFTTCIYDDVENQGAASDNRHIKSIVRPSKTASHFNPHKFRMIPGALTVGEDMDEIASIAWRPITRARLSLHHYAVKSRAEYEEKVQRGNGMTDPKSQGFWDHVETMPHVPCPEMAAYDP